ncbi:tRNA lysidine(34) synthetase TilS [Candidatus Vallotia tarda]|uniref:tRNA(Ile)-lysidine synthase n=1 Tax=Candidatus Vallotiella hemipterorum TaxID=1177213 RepID=A0A916NFK2_9BURK|nr:tRNA lysidine(34) synthetase TilS [Candidatus Vallotia tarda]CAG7601794.1 tRNA(Ile)-lysidine synthase [Candidatus Vallotia tarda]
MKVADKLTADYLVLRAVSAQTATIHCGESIGIAFSGGLDSTVLLHAASRLFGAHRCVGFHVHHGLSSSADTWRSHCIDVTAKLDIDFDCRSVEIPKMPRKSIEALARDARYAALKQMCSTHGIRTLWLGHHADDQAETVLLQLLRGAGLPGLAAMPLRRLLHEGPVYVRPLLSVFKTSLKAYARQYALCWIDDESNVDTRRARNAVRKHVTPTLEIYFPGYRAALARTARHAAAAQRLLQNLTIADLDTCMFAEPPDSMLERCDTFVPIKYRLSRRSLIKLGYDRAINLLRFWMRQSGLETASEARINEIFRQLYNAGDDTALRITYNRYDLCLYRNKIWWESRADKVSIGKIMPPHDELQWSGQSVWYLPIWRGSIVFMSSDIDDERGVQCSVLKSAPLIVRARLGGERMRLRTGGPLRTLKNLFQEAAIPTWRRHLPLLFVGNMLLWVPKLGIDPNIAGKGRIRIEWHPDILLT